MGLFDKLRKARPGMSFPPPTEVRNATGHSPGLPHFAVVDVETTGLDPQTDRVVEIAVITTDPWGRVLDEWSTRINPECPVGATHIHGITDRDVASAPVFADVVAHLNLRLAGAAVAAHHAEFDLGFLRAEYRRAGWEMPRPPTLCTLKASGYYLPMLDRRRLVDCCWAVGTPLVGAHSALGDARATAMLLAAFMHPHVGYPPLSQHVSLPQEALGVHWPAGPAFAPERAVPSAPATRPPPPHRVQVRLAESIASGPAPTLVELVERFSLIDALDEGAPVGALAYLEKLAEVLEDGEVSVEEAVDLGAVAAAENLSSADVAAANQAFVLALAHAALDDGKVTRIERAELAAISEILGVHAKVVPALLDRAEHARNERLGANLSELPSDWEHGEPLRVGDKVVFTGCDDVLRTALEAQSERLGVRVIGTVSPKVALLVTDDTMNGTKAARARDLGTRTVHPDLYAVLIEHLQPAIGRNAKAIPATKSRSTGQRLAGTETNLLRHAATSDDASGTSGPSPSQVRQWARENGWTVGVRGRLDREVLNAYLSAHSEDR